uniref:Uncharacterized protein n=1 Tax=Eutreptiella gymnastica TaxID=73025 RepID=A0A7S1IWF5_9EUGL|mmetsp:Transcript_47933/g.85564  ORF Transcript_47933/g.85564 Transcript_47933/m.85564 type:complete len:179 (+) Transcript_47933:293-829(+)
MAVSEARAVINASPFAQVRDGASEVVMKLLSNDGTVGPVLNLSEQLLTDVSVHPILTALERNTIVRELNLNQNELGDAGAKGLANLLRVNKILTSVSLTGNRVGLAGARALQSAAEGNTTLLHLGLGVQKAHGGFVLGLETIQSTITVQLAMNRVNMMKSRPPLTLVAADAVMQAAAP